MENARVVYYPATEKPLSREELHAIFGKFAPQDALIRAIRQILVERLVEATVDATEPRLTERTAGIVAGRLQEITSLQNEFAQLTGKIIIP